MKKLLCWFNRHKWKDTELRFLVGRLQECERCKIGRRFIHISPRLMSYEEVRFTKQAVEDFRKKVAKYD